MWALVWNDILQNKSKNMTRIVKNITVNWISLVSKAQTPAVEKASVKFALWKTTKLNKNNLEDLKQIRENLKKTFKKTQDDL